ncbi:hypothetical protein D3C81_1144820 [compost metagenome]
MRDEFDSVHDNGRAGRYQRELRPSRASVVQKFQNMPEEDLREVILELFNSKFLLTSEFKEISDKISDKKDERAFVLRGPTGKKAEEIFIAYHEKFQSPIPGQLVDTREQGCGYDFEIREGDCVCFIEVKGINGEKGGISFTNKEWQLAKKEKEKCYLVVVNNLAEGAKINIINNPASKLSVNKDIFLTIGVNWTVNYTSIRQCIDN